ncbi:MAG: hypothetical protein SWE60_14600 [Thermodesulfobacteriota bacterium]|nr:hypothetical protein [Thermodesulfobacteriota bacterium]
MCRPFVFAVAFLWLASGHTHAFVIHTDAYVEGNMSIDMGTAQSTGGQLNRYALEVDSTKGTTYVGNHFESGETGVDIAYVADSDPGLIGGSLSAEEEIGVNTCNSAECRLGVAGSSFDVRELSSSSKGNFGQGTYEIKAQGVGMFGTNAAEKASTSSPSVYESGAYELDGEGVFDLLGEYGFRANVAEEDPLGNALAQAGVTSEDSQSTEPTLCINGPSSVTENTEASYTATFDDGNALDVTPTATWKQDSSCANIDTSGVLSATEVTADQTVIITASLTVGGETQTAEKQVTIVNSNGPPSKPVILAPYDGQTGCDLQPTVVTEPFSDPDADSHAQTRWQISKNAEFDPTIFDMTSTRQLTELTVPEMFLEPDGIYYVRARFYDPLLEPSEWSDIIEFTTTSATNPFEHFTLSISGPMSVMENTTAAYAAVVTFGDGTTQTVTETASWGEDSSYASVDSNGVLSASEVIGNHVVTISAYYAYEEVMETTQMVITITDSNRAPLKPVILYPEDGQMDCAPQPCIVTEAFADPDGDTHRQTQWQIGEDADFHLKILDLTRTQQPTELTMPEALLETGKVYYVRVRFYDIDLKPSEWSDTTHFAVAAPADDNCDSDPDCGDNGHLNGAAMAASDPDNSGNTMVSYANGLAVDFAASGLWHFDGNDWTQLHEDDPQWLALYGNNLVTDHGTRGLWHFDGNDWTQLHEDDPDNSGNTMVSYANGLAVDFGTSGLWHFDGNDWTQLHEDDPQWLALYEDKLVQDQGVLYLQEAALDQTDDNG